MKIAKCYKEKIDELMGGRGMTKFHITGIRHCDYILVFILFVLSFLRLVDLNGFSGSSSPLITDLF